MEVNKDKNQGLQFKKSFAENELAFLFKSKATQEEIDQTIWIALKSDNRKALEYIFEKHVRMLYSYGRKFHNQTDWVEDCIQDVFLEIWNRRKSLTDKNNNIKYYLFKSLRRRIARRLDEEKSKVKHFTEMLTSMETLEFSFETEWVKQQDLENQERALRKAVARLSQRQQEATYLRFYEKLSYAQMADIMNIDIKSAYKLIGKAIESLRQLIV